jgi:pimeloyl-ACP methyl ester carboxylesterase
VVPDMLGYGGTDKPLAVEEYSTKKLCADLAALLDIIGVSRAVSPWGRPSSGLQASGLRLISVTT